MASKCFMCGASISQGILCAKCDSPKKAPKSEAPAPQKTAAPPTPASASHGAPPRAAEATAPQLDPFPKAPVVPFPVESASPSITSIANVLIATGVAAIVLGPDRSVKFVTDEAKRLFGVSQAELSSIKQIEAAAGARIGDVTLPSTTPTTIHNRSFTLAIVPLTGGASGSVLVFRPSGGLGESHASFVAYVRETVLTPMRALRESMAAGANRDPLIHDGAAALDQILSSLEMAPEVEEAAPQQRIPTVTEVVQNVANKFVPFADLKGITLQIDTPELEERFRNYEQLAESLSILMDNSLHYVPAGGQVVIGVRWMEHKGKPLLLFFVMDNGPVVPENLRTAIFEPGFTWNPASPDRTGRGLFRCREFAVAHAGSIWAESKTGKACTFFLRVRPDGVR
jgi:signal transduction histidine kinase